MLPFFEGFELLATTVVGLIVTSLFPLIRSRILKYNARYLKDGDENLSITAEKPPKPTPKIPSKGSKKGTTSNIKTGMQIVVSLVFLGSSIYVILLPGGDAKDKQWAYASAGTILGFWLKH